MNEDWIEVELGEICFTTSGGTPSRNNIEFYQGSIPWVKSGELDKGIIYDTEEHISEDAVKKSSAKVFPEGSLLIALYGATIGKLAFLGVEATTNQAICGIYKNEFIDSKYLYNFLLNRKQKLISQGTGGAQPNISQTILKKLEIPLAPLPIQRAIVSKIEALFSDLDNGIANFRKAQEQLKIYRQAVLKKAFEGELTAAWREIQTNLPTAEELLKQIKEERQNHYDQQIKDWKKAVKEWEKNGKKEKKPNKPQEHKEVVPLSRTELQELADLPKTWKWVKNNELMYYVTSGSRDWKQFYSETKGTYFIRTQDIKTNKLDLNGAAFVDLPDNAEGKRSLIEKGDLLMTITGANVGKIAHVDFEITEAYVSQSVALMKYVLKSFSSYLHYYFQSSATGAKFIGGMVYGVGRPVLSLDNMRDAPISVCSFEEQNQIVQEIESRLSVCDKVEQSINESIEKAEALRQSILKKSL